MDLYQIISLCFRERHSPIEQTHWILQKINEALENKQYCSAEFLDVAWVAPQQEIYLAQTYIHKTQATANDAHQNALSTWEKSKLSTSNKILIFKAILKPIWTYGI
jgi:hypothetical protein